MSDHGGGTAYRPGPDGAGWPGNSGKVGSGADSAGHGEAAQQSVDSGQQEAGEHDEKDSRHHQSHSPSQTAEGGHDVQSSVGGEPDHDNVEQSPESRTLTERNPGQ